MGRKTLPGFCVVLCLATAACAADSPQSHGTPAVSEAASVVCGCELYQKHCDACHGSKGKGDGAAAYCLTKRPDDLSNPDYKTYSDEEYLEVITKGQRTMPRFDKMMTAAQRLQVIAYLKTLIAEDCSKVNAK